MEHAKMEVSAKEFGEKVLASDRPALVNFWGSWCIPCKQMEPVLEELSEGDLDVSIFRVNINRNPGLRAHYQIAGVPKFLMFRDGEERGRIVGAQSPDQLGEFIREHLED